MPDNWNFYQSVPPNALRDLDAMRRRFEAEYARPFMRSVMEHIPEGLKGFAPAVDVYENGDTITVKVEIPGVKQSDIDVSVTEDMLTIKGERKPEPGIKDSDYNRNEIAHGNFYRSIALPGTVDTKNVEAIYEDGILRITIHKATSAKGKKVTIQVKKGSA